MENQANVLLSDFLGKVDMFTNDYQKFFIKGNNAAGTRSRKMAQELKKTLQIMRKSISDSRHQEK